MQIVGGFYREQCCFPEWNEWFGSGGRAAAVVSALSPGSVLHTYSEDINNLKFLNGLGIKTQCHSRSTGIVFSYFHTLSKPYIQPPPHEIIKQSKIEVNGDVVLRFGFLEGEAVIDARRAVYDPQARLNPPSFGANGSIAEELAVVLNELELRCITGIDNINSAALHLMEHQGTKVVVVKGGVRGATVFESNGKISIIPAYRSKGVFKIGTGDVFSAVFTHHWGEKGLSAANAADIASRSVAVYCSTIQLPVEDDRLSQLTPINFVTHGSVLLRGGVDTIGRRYAMEEARFVLRELGVTVSCPTLGDNVSEEESVVLIIEDGLDEEISEFIIQAENAGKQVIVLNETRAKIDHMNLGATEVVDDFSSALYFAAWAAAEKEK